MSVAARLNTSVTVWRPTLVPDGGGGSTTTLVQVGTERARISQPTATERQAAGRDGARLTHVVYVPPRGDVRRGDELRTPAGKVLDVLAVFEPSKPVYRRADCEERQETP